MRVQTPADFLKLIGKRVCISTTTRENISGLVKDLSDNAQHLILLKDPDSTRKAVIPLNRIEFIEVLDADPNLTQELKKGVAPAEETRPAPASALRLNYCEATNSAYIRLSSKEGSHSKTAAPDIVFDYDAVNRLVGIDISEARKTLGFAPGRSRQPAPKLHHDSNKDHLYLALRPKKKAKGAQTKTLQVAEGISFDHDSTGALIGINISDASRKLDLADLGVASGKK